MYLFIVPSTRSLRPPPGSVVPSCDREPNPPNRTSRTHPFPLPTTAFSSTRRARRVRRHPGPTDDDAALSMSPPTSAAAGGQRRCSVGPADGHRSLGLADPLPQKHAECRWQASAARRRPSCETRPYTAARSARIGRACEADGGRRRR